jgi:hypothetical protein
MKPRKRKPYPIVKLKTPITHVEIIKGPDSLNRILIMSGSLTGWVDQDEVMAV